MQHLLEKCSVEYMKFCVEYICWFENCAYKRKLQYSCIIKKGSLFSHMWNGLVDWRGPCQFANS